MNLRYQASPVHKLKFHEIDGGHKASELGRKIFWNSDCSLKDEKSCEYSQYN